MYNVQDNEGQLKIKEITSKDTVQSVELILKKKKNN